MWCGCRELLSEPEVPLTKMRRASPHLEGMCMEKAGKTHLLPASFLKVKMQLVGYGKQLFCN